MKKTKGRSRASLSLDERLEGLGGAEVVADDSAVRAQDEEEAVVGIAATREVGGEGDVGSVSCSRLLSDSVPLVKGTFDGLFSLP